MPLFGKGSGSAMRRPPVLTINGRPQQQPEGPGTAQRRYRLFVECMSRVSVNPLANERASGQPIGNGCGLEELVARIAPLFKNEQSLIRWVALRGAFTSLHIHIFDTNNPVVASPRDLDQAMGVEWVTGPLGEQFMEVAEPWRSRLSAQQRANVLGIALQVLIRVKDYPRLESLSTAQVNSDPQLAGFNDALALDCIAWSAAALLRLGIGPGPRAVTLAPEPDALPQPGWYPEPLWGKAERYWDGSDWTAACRVRGGSSSAETTMSLR